MNKYIIRSFEEVIGENFFELYCPDTITKDELQEKIKIAQKYVENKYDIEELLDIASKDQLNKKNLEIENSLKETINKEVLNDAFFEEMKDFIALGANGQQVFNHYMTLCGCTIQKLDTRRYDFEYEW